jgi:hypothetical protein
MRVCEVVTVGPRCVKLLDIQLVLDRPRGVSKSLVYRIALKESRNLTVGRS